jgi:serine/threonine-protein kinase
LVDGDLLGKRLGHFRVLAKVGQGGMGVVYTAEDEKLGRTIALKVLREDYVSDPTRRARFLREARSAAAVTHANIATVHEVGEFDGQVYIAMELVEGKSLRHLLASRSISTREALRIAKDVARGVARAHDKGIVHRDLKPDNVMVTDDGHAKVLDFGVAKSTQVSEAATHADAPLSKKTGREVATHPHVNVTETGQMMGTPAYMAPEQAMGGRVDSRADVFSFGVMLYEMVTGGRPFESPSAVALLVAAAVDPVELPSKRNPFVTPELERVIMRCLEKKPENRYETMRDLLADLEAVETAQLNSGSLPTLAAHTSAVTAATTKIIARRQRRVVFGAIAVAIAAIVALKLALSPSRPSAVASATPSASAAPSATTLSDLPPPQSSNPAAASIYKTSLKAFRDGNFEEFDQGMRDAVKLDPSFAAGELRLAFAKFHSVRGAITDARTHLEKAARLRASLSEHDQILLEVLEPVINREPPDSDEIERRLRAAVTRFPLDAEFLYLLANEERRYDIDKSIATYDRVLAVDPDFMTALRQKAQTLEMRGDVAEARRLLDECLRRFPGATGCRNERIWLNQDEGRCAEIEPDARQMIAADSESFRGYEALARAAVALGHPPEAIAEALRQAWRRAPAEVRARDELLTNARLAVLAGRFVEAVELGKKYDAAIANDEAASTHAGAALLLAEIAVETGDVRGAARPASDFLRRQVAWSGTPDGATARLLKIQRLAGAISDDELRASRAKFLEDWGRLASRTRFVRGVEWVLGHGGIVESKTDADDALRELPAFAPIPIGQRTAMNDDALGRARLFAGDAAGAAVPLARAAHMCTAMDDPFRHVRAHLLLGRALEASDPSGACDAYKRVLERWGAAKPKSVTADEAQSRMRALACKR